MSNQQDLSDAPQYASDVNSRSESFILPDAVKPLEIDVRCSYGVDSNGCVYYVAVNKKGGENEKQWVSDGFAFISEEVRDERGEAIFTIEGRGAVDGHRFKFTIHGRDFSDERKLRALLVAHYGAANRVGKLTGEVIQLITRDVIKKRLVTTPQWLDGLLIVPGLQDYPQYKIDISNKIPVDIAEGDHEKGLQALRLLLDAWDCAPIAVATALASPFVARWLPDERFGVFVSGTTGLLKTELARHCIAIYGSRFLDERYLNRFGEGATSNALMKLASEAGCLPFLIDNYKPVRKDDPARLVQIIHSVLEGHEKDRLTKEADFKETKEYHCCLLLTGEDLPVEASTLARVLPVSVSKMPDLAKVTALQSIAHHLPAVGREWCAHLNAIDPDLALWQQKRAELVRLAHDVGSVNPGRVGTTASILWLVWRTALKSRLCAAMSEFNSKFETALAKLITESATMTRESTDAQRFVDALREIIATGRVWLSDITIASPTAEIKNPPTVGWVHRTVADGHASRAEFVAIYPDVAIEEARKHAGFTLSVSKATLYKQLEQAGMIFTRVKDGQVERVIPTRHGNRTPRVLRFKPEVFEADHPAIDYSEIVPAWVSIEDRIKRLCYVSDT